MNELSVPIVEGESPNPAVGQRLRRRRGASLMTPLGLVEGEALTYLEEHGATTLRRLIRAVDWPARLVMMGVGALIRDGLAVAYHHDLEIILEPGPGG